MSSHENDPEAQRRANLLRDGLRELGWTEGRNVHIDVRWAGGDAARARAYAAELARLAPDVIIANSTLCLKAVREETNTIPIVFVVVGDPVGQGFVSSLVRPGGNITGFSAFEFQIGGKWVELIKEVTPDVRRIEFLFNPEAGLPYADKFVETITATAHARDVELVVSAIRDVGEIEHTIVNAAGGTTTGLIVNPDAFTTANRSLIISAAARYRLPAIYAYRFYAADGGLLSYGHDVNEPWRRAPSYLDKILKGANPAELPIQQPTKYELIINLKTAKALGLSIPPQLLDRADELIE